MKILLLGGTGALGNHLVTLLDEKKYDVAVTSRSYHSLEGGTKYLHGNAKELAFLESILNDNWDIIVDFMVYTEYEFSERVELLLKSSKHYVFISSARVYNHSNVALTEESSRLLDSSLDKEFLSSHEYSLSKARQENILLALTNKNWTIIRPYISYSSNRLQLGTLEKESWLYRALNGRTIVFSNEMINKITTMTYGFDVAIGIISILNNTDALGKIYHITSEKSCKWEVILNIYLESLENALGYRPNVIFQNVKEFSVWNPQKYQIIYDRLFDRQFDNTAIKRFVNTSNFTDFNVGLRSCIDEFLENPRFLYIDWKFEAIKDKFCNEKTPLSEIVSYKQKIKYLIFRYII